MDFKELVQNGAWEDLGDFDDGSTDEERAAIKSVMKKACILKALLNAEQLRCFADYAIALSDYLQAAKKAAFDRGVSSVRSAEKEDLNRT